MASGGPGREKFEFETASMDKSDPLDKSNSAHEEHQEQGVDCHEASIDSMEGEQGLDAMLDSKTVSTTRLRSGKQTTEPSPNKQVKCAATTCYFEMMEGLGHRDYDPDDEGQQELKCEQCTLRG